MNSRWLLPLGCLILGIAIGWLSKQSGADSQSATDQRGTEPPTRNRKGGLRPAVARKTPWHRLRDDIRAGASEQMPQLLYRALEVPDPVERRQLVFEAFLGMDENNWKEMFEQFVKIRRETGRIHNSEWRLARIKIGQVGGREAVEWWHGQAKGDSDGLQEAVYGWSQTDTQATLDWLNELQDENPQLRRKLLPFTIAGAALREGTGAIRLLEQLPLDERTSCVGQFSWNIMANGGLDAAVDWAVHAHRTTGPGEEAYPQAASSAVYERVFGAAAGGGGGRKMAEYMSRLHEADPVNEARLQRAFKQLNGTEGLDLLAGLTATGVLPHDPQGSSWLLLAAQKTIDQGREGVDGWLDRNSNAPFAETLRVIFDNATTE